MTTATNPRGPARRLQGLGTSIFTEITRLAIEHRAANLGQGFPDFPAPDFVKQAAVAAIAADQNQYAAAPGLPILRRAVAAHFERRHDFAVDPDREVTVTGGATEGVFDAVMALVNPGDEVLVPRPYWVSYPEQARLLGGVPVEVATAEATGFDLDPTALAAAVTPRTRLVVLNSPNNPTGAVFSPAALEAVARLAVERGLWVVSDECYEALTFEGRHVSIASFGPDVKARTIVVNTCSKAYAMTGWRIGYAAGPRALIRAMTDAQSQVTSNPSSIVQWAAVEALTGPQDEVAKMAGEFDRRRRLIVAGLNALPGVRCVMPKGAFYAFANVSGLFGRAWRKPDGVTTLASSLDVTAFLLEAARVAVVPGRDFGSDAHVRLSYATSHALISEGLARMAAALATLQ